MKDYFKIWKPARHKGLAPECEHGEMFLVKSKGMFGFHYRWVCPADICPGLVALPTVEDRTPPPAEQESEAKPEVSIHVARKSGEA